MIRNILFLKMLKHNTNMWVPFILWSILRLTKSKSISPLISGYDEMEKKIYILGRNTLQTIDIDDGYSQTSRIFVNITISLPIDPTHSFVKDSVLHWLTPPILGRFDMSITQQIDNLLFPTLLGPTDGMQRSCVAFNGK